MEGNHSMRLVITEDLKVRIFRDGEDVPFFEQPYYPDQSPWADVNDCTEWGQGYLNWLLNAGAYPEPPLSPVAWDNYRASLPQE